MDTELERHGNSVEVSETAHTIYHKYRELLRAIHSVDHTVSFDTHKKDWTRTARLVLDNRFDVEKFIRAQLRLIKNSKSISPRSLHTPAQAVRDRYWKLNSKNTVEDYEKVCNMLRGRLAVTLRVGQRYKNATEILIDPSTPYADWFRVLACPEENEMIRQLYLEDTIELYKADVNLRSYLNGDSHGFDISRITKCL